MCAPASAVLFGIRVVHCVVPALATTNCVAAGTRKASQPGMPKMARLCGSVEKMPVAKIATLVAGARLVTSMVNESPIHGRLYRALASSGVPMLPGQPEPYYVELAGFGVA